METDVLIIGGGIAGCFAAVKAKEKGAEVILAEKGYVSRSGQTPFAHCTAVFNPEWGHSLEDWMNQYYFRGEYINNREWTEIVLRDSFERYQDLISWGVEFVRDENGEILKEQRPDLASVAPVWIEHGKFGFDWIKPMRSKLVKSEIDLVERVTITDLLKQDGRICGAMGFSMDDNSLYIFRSKATILCAGAAGFKPWGGWPICNLTADGHAMAYRVGAEITGKEFVDYHPRSIEPSLRSEGGPPTRHMPLLNSEGDEVLSRGPDRPLDMDFEAHAGRAPLKRGGRTMVTDGANGMSVHTQEGVWPVDTNCSAGIEGLYAAGDNLATMMVGANYSGMGNATATCSSTGARAGTAAAEYALQVKMKDIREEELERVREITLRPSERKGGFSPGWVTQLLQNSMMPYYISRIKHEDRLKATLTLVEFYRDHLVSKLTARDIHELRLAHETKNMVLNAEMRLRASLFRTESRGAHYREDFPRRDDPNWLAWVILKQEKGEMKVFKRDIPEEWRPDLSIPYEERYPTRFPGE
ncbi:MAG: FAD-binding protein [Deltaproteobacteria bacterium]|nr:FAD-binding protein [Deltaproteobacteria bacterium]